MKPLRILPRQGSWLLPWVLAFFSCLPAHFLSAQSDRPCGAPFLPATDCGTQGLLVLAGSAFQAADGPIPGACNLAYTHDVWVQVVAPSSTPVVAVATYRNMAFGGAVDPTQIHALFYAGSPDCNSLSNVGGCPTLCPLGVVCIDIDNNDGHGRAWRFTGLTAGATYFLRILWAPSPDAAFDTVRVTLSNSTGCFPCDPCAGPGVPLPTVTSRLSATWEGHHVGLHWQPEHPSLGEFQLQRSPDAKNWESLPQALSASEGGYTATDIPRHEAAGWFYRVQHTNLNGQAGYSNVAHVHTEAGTWLRAQAWQADALAIQVEFMQETRLQAFDLQGRVLWEESVQPGRQQLRIPRLLLGHGMALLQPFNAQGLPAERLFASE